MIKETFLNGFLQKRRERKKQEAYLGFQSSRVGIDSVTEHYPISPKITNQWLDEMHRTGVHGRTSGYNFFSDKFNAWIQTPEGKKWNEHQAKIYVKNLPKEKTAKLKDTAVIQPHQERFKQRLDRSGGVLAYHGLGSGKTFTSIAATQGDNPDVIVPASLRTNYKKEIKKHTTGHKANVMSYEKATRHGIQKPGKALILDEVQALGHDESLRSQAIQELAKNYDKKILLSGTPVRNHPRELAPLMNIARGDDEFPTDPAKFDAKFLSEESVKPGFFARVFKGVKPGVRYRIKNEKLFRDLVDGYVDYHAPEKENFPSLSHEVVETPMSSEQMKYYKFVMGQANPALRWKIENGLPPSKSEAKTLNAFLSGVRQVSNSTKAFGGSGESPKITRAIENLTKRQKHDPNFKGVVYSNFLDSGVKSYAEQLDKKKIPYAIFDGSLNDKKRKEIVEDYNSGKIKVLLLSGAGSQGLDLKGTKLVQLLEPHWNNPRLDQTTGRAARYMSHAHLPENERHVHVERYHSTIPRSVLKRLFKAKKQHSVDQYLNMLSKEKEDLNNQFLDILKDVGSQPVPKD